MPALLAPSPVILQDIPLRIDPAEVRAFQGYKPALAASPSDLEARLGTARAEIAAVVRPRLVSSTLAVLGGGPDALTLVDGARFHIPDIGRCWGRVEAVVAAVATVGGEPEALVDARRGAGLALDAALLDSAASAAAECLAEWANDYLCRLGVVAGLRVTNRISPGLERWTLDEQATVFRLSRAGEIGVALRSDGEMTPAKSISFLVGVGRTARVDHYFVQCRRCWAEGCAERRMAPVASIHREGGLAR